MLSGFFHSKIVYFNDLLRNIICLVDKQNFLNKIVIRLNRWCSMKKSIINPFPQSERKRLRF